MNLQEKNLYQQIHPMRLATDWISGLYACYLFWMQNPIPALFAAFIPSLVVSMFIFRWSNLESLKNTPFGRYYKRIYNRTVDLLRFVGFILMAAGSWYHEWIGIGAGLAIIIYTWVYGLWKKKS